LNPPNTDPIYTPFEIVIKAENGDAIAIFDPNDADNANEHDY